MKKLILTGLVLISISANIYAQRNCGTMNHLDQLKKQDPNLEQRMAEMEDRVQEIIESGMSSRAGVYTIPVVVHVVYSSSSQNISDSQIQSQIDVLNEDFRRLNADASSTHSRFTGVAADVQIEFCLANTDPNGNATTGITRTQTSTSSFSDNDNVKHSNYGGKDAWATGKYLNLWSCNLGTSLLGYAQFPGTGSAATDGVVINYRYFGRGGSAQSPFNKGRTATHEIGHWLNLRHIWGDASCGNDLVGDTPTQQTSSSGCPSSSQYSCSSYDMTQNYMDYSDDGCMNIFTAGQSDRMRALFASTGARSGLLTSNGCSGSTGGGGTTAYCASKGNDASYEWIAKVNVGSINNSSAGNGGYKDFTSISTDLEKGTAYPVSLSPGFASSAYDEYWKIWIDLNADGDFSDSGELIFNAGSMSQTVVTGNMTIPTTATAGATRMRVQMKYNGAGSACESFDYGEVEDYSVNIISAQPTCNTPSSVSASGITETSASISWTLSGADNYTVKYRKSGTSSWSSATASTSPKIISGLQSSSTYEYTIGGNCGTLSSSLTSVKTFQTLAPAPTSTYCASKGNDAAYEWIANVKVGTINNASGTNGGYKDFTGISTNLEKGAVYSIVLTPGFASEAYNEWWKVWIDYNQDGDFDDANELVYNQGTKSSSAVTGQINVPATVLSGKTRMRVQMKYDGQGTQCESFSYGEVEDYSVNIVDPSTPPLSYCSSKGSNSSYEWIAKVSIGGIVSTTGNNGGYKDFTSFNYNMTQGNAYNVELTPGFASDSYNEYWKIWIDYNGDGDFNDSGELAFNAGSLSSTMVSGQISVPVTAASKTTRMRVQMKYNGAGTSCETFSYGEVEDYTVTIGASSRLAEDQTINNASARFGNHELEEKPKVSIYPNPAKGITNLELTAVRHANISIIDQQGRLIDSFQYNNDGFNNLSLDVNSYNSGIYFIMVGNEKFNITERLVVVK